MATTSEKTLRISLPCPACCEANASISLNLGNADLKCNKCDAEFTVDIIKELLARWGRVILRVESMPSDE